jgi:acyl carrier protein
MSNQLRDLVLATLGLPAEQVTLDVNRYSVSTWTGLKHLQLVAAIEDAFGVVLPPREIRRIRSVNDLCGLLHQREVRA